MSTAGAGLLGALADFSLIEADAHASGQELARDARAWVAALGEGHGRLLVWSSRAREVLLALAAADHLGATLFVAHATLPEAQVEALIAEHGVSAAFFEGEAAPRLRGSSPRGEGARVVVMTSGTTGAPKLAEHPLSHLLATLRRTPAGRDARWLLSYPPTTFAGLQVALTALLGGGTLVAPADRSPDAQIAACRAHGVTHASGTPTFWRGLLLALAGAQLPLRQITLGGEAADQPTLDRVAAAFPGARIVHIYATTELGVVFRVNDGRAGFPAAWLDDPGREAELRVVDGVLEVRSPRRMAGYRSADQAPASPDGWLRTGDLVRVEGDRARFEGRADRLLNTGGNKVRPEEVEAALLEHPAVADARVFGLPSPLVGEIVAAEVVLALPGDEAALRVALLQHLRARLEAYKAPRNLRFVASVVGASGKKSRSEVS